MTGKEIITFLLETNFLNNDGQNYLSKIFKNLNKSTNVVLTENTTIKHPVIFSSF